MNGHFTLQFPNGDTRTQPADQLAYRLGRADDNDLVLNDSSVSRRHARLSREGDQWMLEDLASASGTFIDSQQLPPNTPTPLLPGQVVRLGVVQLVWEVAPPDTPPAAPPAPQARFGVLLLDFPDGTRTPVPLDRPSLTLGQTPENDVVLNDRSVSPRHARLTVESGRLMITDLGRGITVDGTRLPANTPSLLAAGAICRVGRVTLRYQPPAEVALNTPAAPLPQAVSVPLNLAWAGPVQPVTPGSPVTATLTLHNRATVVDEVTLSVADLPAAWVTWSQARVPLYPGARATVTLTIQPPRQAEALAGTYHFSVQATSREHAASVSATGQVTVLPFYGLGLALQPVRSQGNFTVMMHNQGNTPVTYGLSGMDDENRFVYDFAEQALTLQPGARHTVPVRVSAPNPPRRNGHDTWPFAVVATRQGADGVPVQARGQLQIAPPPRWPLMLALLSLGVVTLLLLGAGALTYLSLCPTMFPGAPLCPTPVAVPPTTTPAPPTLTLAPTPPPVDRAVQLLDEAMRNITQAPETWRTALQQVVASLPADLPAPVLAEAQTRAGRALAGPAANFPCSADFMAGRAVQELGRLKATLTQQPAAPVTPAFCQTEPAWLDLRSAAASPTITFYGYNLDQRDSLGELPQVQLVSAAGLTWPVAESRLIRLNHTQLIVNLAAMPELTENDITKVVVVWANSNQGYPQVAVVREAMPTPTFTLTATATATPTATATVTPTPTPNIGILITRVPRTLIVPTFFVRTLVAP